MQDIGLAWMRLASNSVERFRNEIIHTYLPKMA